MSAPSSNPLFADVDPSITIELFHEHMSTDDADSGLIDLFQSGIYLAMMAAQRNEVTRVADFARFIQLAYDSFMKEAGDLIEETMILGELRAFARRHPDLTQLSVDAYDHLDSLVGKLRWCRAEMSEKRLNAFDMEMAEFGHMVPFGIQNAYRHLELDIQMDLEGLDGYEDINAVLADAFANA